MITSLTVVRSIRNKMFDDLWIKLGGEELRLILNQILKQSWKINTSASISSSLYWATRAKIQQDILKERSKDYEKC